MGISYLIVRNAYRHPVENAKAMINFLKMDFRGFALSPYLLANAVLLAVKGNLDFRLKLNAATGAGPYLFRSHGAKEAIGKLKRVPVPSSIKPHWLR